MDAFPQEEQHVAAIRSACWLVRYNRPRTPAMRARRAAAIRELGLAVRAAFNQADDFEPLLVAIVDGLNPRDEAPPF